MKFAKLNSPPLSNLKDLILFSIFYSIYIWIPRMFESLTFVFKVLIPIVMFLSLMKVIKYLVPPKDLIVKGPQMLVCTRSKTFSTFHVFTFGKKNSTVTFPNIFHKWDIMFREAWVFLKLSLSFRNSVGLQNSYDLICNYKKMVLVMVGLVDTLGSYRNFSMYWI